MAEEGRKQELAQQVPVQNEPTQPAKKKKKKNAPDKPQPAWLFPPDEENPVLNPKPVSDEKVRKDKEDRGEAIKFLQFKSVTAPMKPPPPGELLTLVGVFLTAYGFNSASRLFTLERNARKKLSGWHDEIGVKIDKGIPDLVKIFKDWHKEFKERRELGMTSSDEEDDSAAKRAKMARKKQKLSDARGGTQEDETSSSGSSENSSSESGVDKKVKRHSVSSKKSLSPSRSSSASTSDSDADDEKETAPHKQPPTKTALPDKTRSLKRKASSSASASSSKSESDSEDSSSDPPSKKKKKASAKDSNHQKAATKKANGALTDASSGNKPNAKPTRTQLSANSSELSKPIPSTSGSEPLHVKTTISAPAVPSTRKQSTDSSATLEAGSPKKKDKQVSSNSGSSVSSNSSSTSSTSSDSEAPPPSKPEKSKSTKRKPSRSPNADLSVEGNPAKVAKKQVTPFSRIPKDIKIDAKLSSNAYVPYNYADRAHQDLSVTKGKGFTKEKNKKKRGSYKGGMIDTSGGKGYKFE
ncbi:hypothetical protein MMC20_006272 [Loxospora ochrophaea]|nr:hypothetical protein [Loxospora ochrophaea]